MAPGSNKWEITIGETGLVIEQIIDRNSDDNSRAESIQTCLNGKSNKVLALIKELVSLLDDKIDLVSNSVSSQKITIGFSDLISKISESENVNPVSTDTDSDAPNTIKPVDFLANINQVLDDNPSIKQKFEESQIHIKTKNSNLYSSSSISDLEWVDNLKSLIASKILSNLFTIDELSSDVFMSRTQFFTKVKSLTGETPASLIRNIRLCLAYKMLKEAPKTPFSEICLLYTSPSPRDRG